MIEKPDRCHLSYTLASLARQNFKNFEVIIADCLYATRFREPFDTYGLDVYHVPVESQWIERGYPAISASRNAGITFAESELVVFVDDCSLLPDYALECYVYWYKKKKAFANALHIRMRGDKAVGFDTRFELLQPNGPSRFRFNSFGVCGYMSASLEACLKLNGFDEAFDGSRQLEDGDFGTRLRAAGYNLVIDRELVVYEQEHGGPIAPNGSLYRNPPRCNGPWAWWRNDDRPGEFAANTRDWTEDERRRVRPCSYLDGRICRYIGRECNMWGADGRHTHIDVPDEFLTAPVFDLTARRERALQGKEHYRVIG